MSLLSRLNELAEKKEAFIERYYKYANNTTERLQAQLLSELVDNFITRFQLTEGGIIATNSFKNYRLVNELDSLMDDFSRAFLEPFVKNIGNKMLELTELNADYYKGMNIRKATIDSIIEKTKFLQEKIGLTTNNTIIKGSYLDDLVKTPELRTQLKTYVSNNVAGNKTIADFQKGFSRLLRNGKEQNGLLTRYYQQYTFDAMNKADEAVNKHFADNLKLEYFIYTGTVMARTRCFCRKRAGMVFHVDDVKQWINDPTLPVTPGYSPLIDRGSYNCRHAIRYITEDLAEQMGYNKEAARAVVNGRC